METGMIFDIQEFSVNDGPGLRIVVFLKGCPLRCRWCHNPEGQSFVPQINAATGRMVGETWTSRALVDHLMRFRDAFAFSSGGVTFSGGEPLAQLKFLKEVSDELRHKGINVIVETSGYCSVDDFDSFLKSVDFVFFDLKCLDASLHKQMTGVDNEVILANLRTLAATKVKYSIRIPTLRGVSDTQSNRTMLSDFLSALPRNPDVVEWLPFNEMAGAKYKNFGMEYAFNE